ncbi:MAG: hypothetical protein CFE21_02945 [Bacteroidetes bacterium B1(2017)]|nr:MAG: hypothetical protein CFE21_02945 [Bacteroidetes bacterium B1(2017)]
MKHILYSIALVLTFSSCEKAFFDKEIKSTSPTENFEYLWNQCNTKYAFMDYKNINWDERHAYYKARINDGMTKEALFTELANMMNDLKDGHVNLVSNFNISNYHFNFKGINNINERIVDEFYLKADGVNGYSTGPFLHNFVGNGTVGYIRFKEFPGTVTDDQLDFIIDRYQNTKGLIIDVRQNGGGAVSDLWKMVSHLISEKTLCYQTFTKNGPGRNDFEGPANAFAEPNGKTYTKKIYILTDRGTFSSGSHFTLAMRNVPHAVIMGDTTGGGMGLPNGGQLPNGWTYRFSVTSTRDLDGSNFENGVPPDVISFINPSDSNKDAVIEAAILEINK